MDIKGSLGTKVGPLPMAAWGAIAIGAVVVFSSYKKSSNSGSTSNGTSTQTVGYLDANGNPIVPVWSNLPMGSVGNTTTTKTTTKTTPGLSDHQKHLQHEAHVNRTKKSTKTGTNHSTGNTGTHNFGPPVGGVHGQQPATKAPPVRPVARSVHEQHLAHQQHMATINPATKKETAAAKQTRVR